MKYLVILLTMGFVSESALAALSIKPGLWTVQSILKRDGQEIDAGKMMKEAMAKMSPEQRKQMEAMMAKMGGEGGPAFRMGDNGMQVCYTKELLKNEEMLNQVIAGYLQHLPPQMERLEKAVVEEDVACLRHELHQLKATMEIIGIRPKPLGFQEISTDLKEAGVTDQAKESILYLLKQGQAAIQALRDRK